MDINSNDGLPPVNMAHRSKSSSSGHAKKSVRRLTVAEVAKEHEIRKLQELIHDDELNIDPDMKTNGKLLVLLVILLAIVSFTLFIIIMACWVRTAQKQTDTTETSKHTDICLTKECVLAAASIESSIDYSVKPCDDFYQFACGRWRKEHSKANLSESITKYTLFRDHNQRVLRDMINQVGSKPLQELLVSEFGGWPLTYDKWEESQFNLLTIVKKVNVYEHSTIFNFDYKVHDTDSFQRMLVLDKPLFGLHFLAYYKNEKYRPVLDAYEEAIYHVGKLLGFRNATSARDEVKALVNLEIQMANFRQENSSAIISSSIPIRLEDIHDNYSQILDLRNFLISLMTSPEVGVSDFNNNDTIIHLSRWYFQNLESLIPSTDNRTLANYIIWKFILMCMRHGTLGEKFQSIYNTLMKPTMTMHEHCIDETTKALGSAVSKMFIADYSDRESYDIVLNMAEELKKALDHILEESDWMDEAAKKYAKAKNSYMKFKIGYPDVLENDTALDQMYINYTFNKDTFFQNIMLIRKERFYANLRRFRQPVTNDEWIVEPTHISVSSYSTKSEITVPGAVVQSPYFIKRNPMSLNYGSLGPLIGMRYIHWFDVTGLNLDDHGNRRPWWSARAADRYVRNMKCLEDQLANYLVKEANMTVKNLINQLASSYDIGALKQAFQAYRQWVLSRGEEEANLPALNFTHNQLFFLSYAQAQCGVYPLEKLKEALISDVNFILGEVRVNGPLPNVKAFSETFECPVGSPMNPIYRCNVW
ncbi:neprilysin-1-like isoform X3 [Biomphalaria glabrata]|uniref:Neprilysin-1-like isoform X3 n=1 Tax=Biomphalaria glabrata TaxID=6526 RepID=A0A9W2YQ20_BIOGL|nr:neprilysin-1-like isoform X3 [Biomphalaria glabrata]